MSVAYLREAVRSGDSEKLIRFVRLHLGGVTAIKNSHRTGKRL